MLKILLIEDNGELREIFSEYLRMQEYTVVAARDGIEAMQHFREGDFDVVITDLSMPKKDGLQTIMELRKQTSELRIIAMSGGSRFIDDLYFNQARDVGANAVLQKPFNLPALRDAVAEVMSLAS